MRDEAAILIVNGGRDPSQGRWLPFCVGKILTHTPPNGFRLYVWNNNIHDEFVSAFLRYIPHVTLIQAPPNIQLSHVHADPLQRLYERARSDGARVYVTLDSDAHPIHDGWLDTLLDALENGAVLAGAWRDELKQAIPSYIHASCLATTAEFIDAHHLRFDFIAPNSPGDLHDTLSSFSETARRLDLPMHLLERSNARNLHRLMGGVYGDMVYHHGAGSRAAISFWDEQPTPEAIARNVRAGEIATHFLFTRYEDYMSWLRGADVDAGFARELESLASGNTDAFVGIPRAVPSEERSSFTFGVAQRLAGRAVGFAKRTVGRTRRKGPWDEARRPPELMWRPFQPADCQPLPDGWEVRPPDFVGVGVPKAGTSWWYNAMLQHPKVCPHRLHEPGAYLGTKELHYFLHFGWRTMRAEDKSRYRDAFAAPPGSISGEWSALYLLHPLSIQLLAETVPETKVVVLLRNPVDRFVSHVNHVVRNRGAGFRLSGDWLEFFRKYSVMPEAYLHGHYALGLSELIRLFPRERILVLQYERCRRDPEAEMARTFEFLGVDTSFRPAGLERSVNRLDYVVDKPDAAGRKRLASLYAGDARICAELFPELDLNLWADFHVE